MLLPKKALRLRNGMVFTFFCGLSAFEGFLCSLIFDSSRIIIKVEKYNIRNI